MSAKGRGGRNSRRQWMLQIKKPEQSKKPDQTGEFTADDQKRMKELGLDEEAYREFKKMPERPKGPSGVANRLTIGNVLLGWMGGNVQRDFTSENRARQWDDRLQELRNQTAERRKKAESQKTQDYAAQLRGQETPTQAAARVAEEEKKAKEAAAKKAAEVQKEEKPVVVEEGPDAESGEPQKTPLTPKKPLSPQVSTIITRTKGGTVRPVYQVDGKIVDPTDTVAVNHARQYEREAHAQHVREYNERRRQEEIDRIRSRAEEARKEREATKAKYAQINYDKAKFSTREGWQNLGLREGEKSGASFAEGSAERKAYDERVAKIREGFKGVTDSYKNGYITNGGNIAGINKVFEEGAAAGTLSDKQLEALEKRIGSWSKTASDKKSFMDRELAVLNEQSARRYLGAAAKGLGREAAIAIANGQRLSAVQTAAKALSDVNTSEADRLTHSETLLKHGIDIEAIGRNRVETDAKLRDRFIKEAGGKNDAETFSRLYKTYGLEGVNSAKSYDDIIGGLQIGSNGVGLRTPAVAEYRQNEMKNKDEELDRLIEELKPIDHTEQGEDKPETSPLQPKTDEEIAGALGTNAARRGGFARRMIDPTVLKPRG